MLPELRARVRLLGSCRSQPAQSWPGGGGQTRQAPSQNQRHFVKLAQLLAPRTEPPFGADILSMAIKDGSRRPGRSVRLGAGGLVARPSGRSGCLGGSGLGWAAAGICLRYQPIFCCRCLCWATKDQHGGRLNRHTAAAPLKEISGIRAPRRRTLTPGKGILWFVTSYDDLTGRYARSSHRGWWG